MEICCASKAAIKNIKIARKKQPFLPKKIKYNLFFPKSTDFWKKNI